VTRQPRSIPSGLGRGLLDPRERHRLARVRDALRIDILSSLTRPATTSLTDSYGR
jgi:hypothetical protein